MSPEAGPRAEYEQRLAARRETFAQLERTDLRWSNVRLATFLGGAALLVAAWLSASISILWMAVPVLIFIGAAARHDFVLRAKRRAASAIRFYEEGLARIEGTWPGNGRAGVEYRPEEHFYATDLDLFGEGSLFELLCTARTGAGESALASWLLEGAAPEEILARQKAVAELSPRLDERERMYLDGGELRARIQPPALIRWCTHHVSRLNGAVRIAMWVLPAGTIISLYLWLGLGWAPLAFVIFALLELSLLRNMKTWIEESLRGLEEPAKDIESIGHVLARIEAATFASPRLRVLQDSLREGDIAASDAIRRLKRYVAAADAMRNHFFAPLWIGLLWPIHCGKAVNDWRARHGKHVETWLRAVGDFEALHALAGYSHEHPDDPFPELSEATRVFDAKGIAHPLLADRACVTNDVRLDETTPLWMVSGSNMSGKSTLLRTVGVNTVLAMAGAPVRAKSLTLSPLAIGASLHVVDSIQRGASHFYAEIERLKAIQDLTAGPRTVLFLIDEILHGTNSHDRRIGAEAIVRTLLAKGGIGLVTTHDLAIDGEAPVFGGRGKNVHFADDMDNGQMVFDYRIREGVVRHSNALKLIRSIGLDVPEEG